MQKQTIFRYYRVYQNRTAVTEVSVNDFRPVPKTPLVFGGSYSLPEKNDLFRDYVDRAEAMEQAKLGALAHINEMISEVEVAIARLINYRNDNHEDLNVNLLEANIRKFKRQMYIK